MDCKKEANSKKEVKIGDEFGLWKVIAKGEPIQRFKSQKRRWLCECKCGNQHLHEEYTLLAKLSSACRKCCKKKKFEWTNKKLSQLGKVSDYKLAIQWETSVFTVFKKRKSLGIASTYPRHRYKPLTEAKKKLLGKVPDSQLAIKWNMSGQVIGRIRRKLGITSNFSSEKRAAHLVTREDYLEAIKQAGSVHNLANQVGLSKARLYQRMKGIGLENPAKLCGTDHRGGNRRKKETA